MAKAEDMGDKEDPVGSNEMEKQTHCKGKGSVEERVPPIRGKVASERKCTICRLENVWEGVYCQGVIKGAFLGTSQ